MSEPTHKIVAIHPVDAYSEDTCLLGLKGIPSEVCSKNWETKTNFIYCVFDFSGAKLTEEQRKFFRKQTAQKMTFYAVLLEEL